MCAHYHTDVTEHSWCQFKSIKEGMSNEDAQITESSNCCWLIRHGKQQWHSEILLIDYYRALWVLGCDSTHGNVGANAPITAHFYKAKLTDARWQMVWVVFTSCPAVIHNASFVWHAVKCLQKEGWKWLSDTVAIVCIVKELKLCKLHILKCWIQSL